MGRHAARFGLVLVFALLATACGLRPGGEELQGSDGGDACPTVERPAPVALELGVVVETESAGTTHVLCDVEYATSPPTSGDHFPVWQSCGFYTEPIRDETAVHALEHGAIWIAYDPELDATEIDAISSLVFTDGHYIASPYPGLQNPIVLSAWQRQVAVERIGDQAARDFAATQLGRVSETAPEAGVTCESQLGAPPFDPDRGYQEIFDQLAAG